ncbi:hypothetical protein, partial [Bifidobacterium aquikefiri]
MTSSTFFLNRLSSEPHAVIFGGQSTPWTTALAELTTDPTLEAGLRDHVKAAERLLSPVYADLMATNGRSLDIF